MKIRKAIIACAGFGTRFLPITKTIQKEMLPILNRPLIDYVVEDCVRAGIEEIIFVVKEGHDMVHEYYTQFSQLTEYLNKMGKFEKLAHFTRPTYPVSFQFVTQSLSDQYGTAVPVRLAANHVSQEDAFLVFMGDDFIFNPDGTSEARAMIDLFKKSQASALATCIEKEPETLHKYGIAEISQKNNYQYLKKLIEKPAPGTAPSNLANISKYIFTPAVFDKISKQKTNPQSGELYITDTITAIAQSEQVVVHTPKGQYLDGGDPLSWLRANLVVAKHHPEYQQQCAEMLQSL